MAGTCEYAALVALIPLVLTNLLRPWVLSRLLSGGAALALTAFGAFVAWRVLRYWHVGASSEGQLALERRSELVAAVVQVGLAVATVNLFSTVLMADRLTHSIRGAMCAWGVFDASPWGFLALGTAALSAAACAFWVVLHRLDLSLSRPALTRRKLIALFAVLPILLFDLYATARWVLDLDMLVVASCCSIGLDDAVGGATSSGGGPRGLAAGLALGAGLAAVLAGVFAWRRPARLSAWLAAASSAAAGALAIPAILWYVAPHAYESPHHLCPFCLLHADVGGIGWPLFTALFVASLTGTSLAVVELQRRAADEPAPIEALQRRLAAWSTAAWLLTIALAVAPVLRWAWIAGGASLFGTP